MFKQCSTVNEFVLYGLCDSYTELFKMNDMLGFVRLTAFSVEAGSLHSYSFIIQNLIQYVMRLWM